MRQLSAPISTSVRQTAIALTAAINTDLRSIAAMFWEIGEKLRRVSDEKLYAELGYATFRAYLDGELNVTSRQAFKMVACVRAYVRDDAEAIGFERGVALITYARAHGGSVDPGRLVREDAPIAGKPVSTCTVRDLKAAAHEARRQRLLSRSRSQAARTEARRAKEVVQALRRFLGEHDLGRVKIAKRKDAVVLRLAFDHLDKRFAPEID